METVPTPPSSTEAVPAETDSIPKPTPMDTEHLTLSPNPSSTSLELEENAPIISPRTPSTQATNPDTSESLELRYTKIKQYALRLKKALADKTDEIERLTNEKNSKKAISTLQLEYDKALYENEKLKSIQKTMENDLKGSIEENLRLKETSFQNITQIQNLTATNIILKDKLDKLEKDEADLQKLKSRIAELELELKNTHESQIDMKQEKRQTAILALEITDYEKKLADLNEKYEEKIRESNIKSEALEENYQKISTLQSEILAHETTIQDLTKSREQLNSEINRKSEKIQYLQEEYTKLNERLTDKKSEHSKLQQEYENLKLSFSSESKIQVEKSESLILQNTKLEHKISVLEQTRRSLESQVSNLKLELNQMESEFNNYKQRAQARLNSSKPFNLTGANQPDELENLQKVIHEFNSEISILKSDLQTLKLENENLILERAELGLKLNKFKTDSMEKEHSLVSELQKTRNDFRTKETEIQKLIEKNRLEHEAMVTSYKVQIEAIKADYESKIKNLEEKLVVANARTEQQEAHDEEFPISTPPMPMPRKLLMSHEGPALSQLEQQLRKNYEPLPVAFDHLMIPPAERGECEGSEEIPQPTPKKHSLTFEELLTESSTSGNEKDASLINSYKTELVRSQNQVKHLTSLLRESESNCERLAELSEALKEEIRRVERDAQRKEHLKENTEYLKNVILKYTTLHGADEKLRLIPVLKTMLKLSPEEVETLESSVRGGSVASTPSAIAAGLSSLIPRWSPG